jgi:hypothetical protein
VLNLSIVGVFFMSSEVEVGVAMWWALFWEYTDSRDMILDLLRGSCVVEVCDFGLGLESDSGMDEEEFVLAVVVLLVFMLTFELELFIFSLLLF